MKDETLAELAKKCVQAVQSDLALTAVLGIKDTHLRDRVLMTMVEHYAEVGRYGEALRIVDTMQNAECKVIALSSVGIKMKTFDAEFDATGAENFQKLAQEIRSRWD